MKKKHSIKDFAVKFGSGQDTSKGGRPKKIYTILKEKGYGKQDIVTAFGELAFYTKEELSAVSKNEEMPIITRIISKQFLEALKGGNWGKIKEILEHVIGKPDQKTHIEHEDVTKMDMISYRIGGKKLKKKGK